MAARLPFCPRASGENARTILFAFKFVQVAECRRSHLGFQNAVGFVGFSLPWAAPQHMKKNANQNSDVGFCRVFLSGFSSYPTRTRPFLPLKRACEKKSSAAVTLCQGKPDKPDKCL